MTKERNVRQRTASKILASAAVSVSVLALAGCATHDWAPGPNANGTFGEAKARCSIMARHSGGSFYAAGSPQYVAGAAAGAAMGDAIRAQADFNDCMSASGWIIADTKKGAVKLTKPQIDAMRDELKTCIETVRNNHKYSALSPHLRATSDGRYSLVQMADNTYPSADESSLLAAFGDEEDACREKTLTQIAASNPGAAQSLRLENAKGRDLELELINK